MVKSIYAGFFVLFTIFILSLMSCSKEEMKTKPTEAELIAKGKYLVAFGGCNDCHTPKIFNDKGMMLDTTRILAGHRSDAKLADIDSKNLGPGKWILTNGDATAWVGPWGMSYAANLTPDKATGIGALSEEMFIKTLREGKWMGVGRPLLPPMPWQGIGQLSDEDLGAVYHYLMSLKPVNNKVPDPVNPDMMMKGMAMK